MKKRMKFQYNLIAAVILTAGALNSQIPVLNSRPAITNKVIYLDFDGQVVSGTSWNNGNTVNAAASTISNANKILVWKRITEDYMPFDVNLTTEESRFNSAPANKRIRVVITPTSSWYGNGAGGVAYVGSFTWGGTPGTPCWVFENMLSYNPKSIAEAAAHEIGHTLTLRHQSTYDAACNKTNEYNPGLGGTGITSWAPIMGVGYSRNVTVWHNGKSATACNTIQYDHGSSGIGITASGYLSFMPDDVGDNFSTAKFINLNALNTLDSGLITTPADLDVFRFNICQNRYVTVDVKPWALDTNAYGGANLDVRLHLYDAGTNNLIAVDTNLTRLYGRVGVNLTPGSYYFTIDGGRSSNYSDYGSLGRYYVNVKATNPPTIAGAILPSAPLCEGQSSVLTASSTASSSSWQWTITGTSGSNQYATQNPIVSFNTAGVYTLELLTSNASATSCPFTGTLLVAATPTMSVTGTNTSLCAPASTSLFATGAQTYTWLPGNLNGNVAVVSPSVTTTYTIVGANSSCSSAVNAVLNVIPSYTINVAVTSSILCYGESLTLTASGASNYTINPGGVASASAVFTPSFNTNFLVFASQNGCTKVATQYIVVVPEFTVNASATDSSICIGDQVMLNFTGATTYVLEPGSLVGNTVMVQPQTTTIYTVTGITQSTCASEAQLLINVEDCVSTLDERLTAGLFKIYPNPAHDRINIQGPEGRKILLLSVLGQELQSIQLSEGKGSFDASNLPAGIYFVRLEIERGRTMTYKVIVD
jgi:hypothetical protein